MIECIITLLIAWRNRIIPDLSVYSEDIRMVAKDQTDIGLQYLISSKLSITITHEVESTKFKDYWRRKKKFGLLSHTAIDWDTL